MTYVGEYIRDKVRHEWRKRSYQARVVWQQVRPRLRHLRQELHRESKFSSVETNTSAMMAYLNESLPSSLRVQERKLNRSTVDQAPVCAIGQSCQENGE